MKNKLPNLLKAESPEDYAARANEGILLAHPIKINGQDKRPDNGISYHSTIKDFDHQKDHPHSIHELAQHLPLNPPDAKNTQIEPGQFKDRFGKDVYVLKLKGNSADRLKEHNGKFAHMGFPSTTEWTPHISLDQNTWQNIKNSGARTAHEAGIEFGDAVLKHGPKVIKTYRHKPDTTEPTVPDESDFTAKANIPVTKSESNEIELKKDQGRITFPKLGTSSRPDQEVANVATERQGNIVGRSWTNKVMPQISSEHKTKVSNAVSNKALSPKSAGTTMVNNAGKGSTPSINLDAHKNSAPNRNPQINKEHEAFHHTMNQVRYKHGDEKGNHVLDTLMSHIHPEDVKHISQSLKNRGYSDSGKNPLSNQQWKEEIVNHVRDAVHDKTSRNLLPKESHQRLKNSWQNMRNSAKDIAANKFVVKSEEILGQNPLMKPFVSEAQRRWGHTAAGEEALGGEAGVHEWDEATKGKKLPEKVAKAEDKLPSTERIRSVEAKVVPNKPIGWGGSKEHSKNKIIGKAPSGNNIYDSHDHPEHKNLTHEDHAYAAGLHAGHQDRLIGSPNPEEKRAKKNVRLDAIEGHARNYSGHMRRYSEKNKDWKLGQPSPEKPKEFEWGKEDAHKKAHSPYIPTQKSESSISKAEKPLEKGALKNAAVAGAMLIGSHANAASGHLHQFVTGLSKLPGVKAESVFTPHKAGTQDGQGQYRVKVGNYTINGHHNSMGGNNTHHTTMYGPKNPTSQDKADEGKAQFLRNKLTTTGQQLLDKSESLSKALALSGDSLKKYIEDNKELRTLFSDKK